MIFLPILDGVLFFSEGDRILPYLALTVDREKYLNRPDRILNCQIKHMSDRLSSTSPPQVTFFVASADVDEGSQEEDTKEVGHDGKKCNYPTRVSQWKYENNK